MEQENYTSCKNIFRGNKFSEKRVALFCTNLGSQSERVFKTLKQIMNGCVFVGELAISNVQKNIEHTEKIVSEWSKSLIV